MRSAKQLEDCLLAGEEARGSEGKDVGGIAKNYGLTVGLVQRWKGYLKGTDEKHPVFGPWHVLANLPAGEFGAKSGSAIQKMVEGKAKINPLVLKALAETPVASLRELAHVYAGLFAKFDQGDKLESADAGGAAAGDAGGGVALQCGAGGGGELVQSGTVE